MSKDLLTLIDEVNECMSSMTPVEVAEVECKIWKVTPSVPADETPEQDRRIRIAVALKHVAYATKKD
jgi:hypothetical protein